MTVHIGDILQQIAERQHAVVPFPVARRRFEVAMDAFFDFLKLPQDVKDAVYFQRKPGERGSEVGYKRYLRDRGNTDNREYFHYHEAAEERFGAMEIPELRRLLEVMREIYGHSKSVLDQVLHRFEDEFPGIYAKFFPVEGVPDFYLRFLKYDRLTPGEFLAKGHYDRGGCTLALAESAPGLRMGLDDQHLNEVVHEEGKALFMPGLKFPDVTDNRCRPTWHDVVQRGEDGYRDDIARWAVVFFADQQDMGKITYDEAHAPIRM